MARRPTRYRRIKRPAKGLIPLFRGNYRIERSFDATIRMAYFCGVLEALSDLEARDQPFERRDDGRLAHRFAPA